MDNRDEILDRIVEAELEMFQQVNIGNDGYSRACKEKPQTFKLMRGMSHSVLSTETIKSYLSDLMNAQKEKRNLMTEKYALMEELIPHPYHDPELINDIVENELIWMSELREKYPDIIRGDSGYFKKYMICEYETYSEETLRSLRKDILKAKQERRNLPELRYKNLFKRLGYDSIEEGFYRF